MQSKNAGYARKIYPKQTGANHLHTITREKNMSVSKSAAREIFTRGATKTFGAATAARSTDTIITAGAAANAVRSAEVSELPAAVS
jgi:hypothetical protein